MPDLGTGTGRYSGLYAFRLHETEHDEEVNRGVCGSVYFNHVVFGRYRSSLPLVQVTLSWTRHRDSGAVAVERGALFGGRHAGAHSQGSPGPSKQTPPELDSGCSSWSQVPSREELSHRPHPHLDRMTVASRSSLRYGVSRGVRHEYEYCDACVNRSDDNILDVCFQESQLTSDPTTTPQQCNKGDRQRCQSS